MSKIAIGITGAVVAATLAVLLVVQQQTIKELRQETETLRQQVAQAAPLQEQLDHATQAAARASSSAESQKHELVRLRAEVSTLRGQSKALSEAQQEIQKLSGRLASTTENLKDQSAALQEEIQKKQSTESGQHMNACINNLRLIDSAKQQWALENKKQATDTPTMDDLLPYFGPGPNNTNAPSCPEAGVYTIGPISERPTCSISGHVLP